MTEMGQQIIPWNDLKWRRDDWQWPRLDLGWLEKLSKNDPSWPEFDLNLTFFWVIRLSSRVTNLANMLFLVIWLPDDSHMTVIWLPMDLGRLFSFLLSMIGHVTFRGAVSTLYREVICLSPKSDARPRNIFVPNSTCNFQLSGWR